MLNQRKISFWLKFKIKYRIAVKMIEKRIENLKEWVNPLCLVGMNLKMKNKIKK